MLEGAVVGKQPTLSPRSTAKREPLAPTVIGDGTIVSTGAIVFAGSQIGARVILGDQSCVRERVAIGDDVVLGRGSYVENDTTIGAMTKIQADAYITAYSTLEEHVFIAPCVVTTNDNWMGRTEKRLSEMQRADDPPRRPHRRRRHPLPRSRDRRGSLRRRRRGRDEGRPGARRDGRKPGPPHPGRARRGAAREPVGEPAFLARRLTMDWSSSVTCAAPREPSFSLDVVRAGCPGARASPGRSTCRRGARDEADVAAATGGRAHRRQVVDVFRTRLPEDQVCVGSRRPRTLTKTGWPRRSRIA